MTNGKIQLAIFASGAGSNAAQICKYFKNHPHIDVRLIVSNRKHAGVLQVAADNGIESIVVPKLKWKEASHLSPIIQSREIDYIILAGFLLLLPSLLIMVYRGRILNIHPALLPKYGGKGMYGSFVHQQVKAAGDLVSGITIHEVNEHYDEGDIIFQEKVALSVTDSAEDIGRKVLALEHFHYPHIIEKWIRL